MKKNLLLLVAIAMCTSLRAATPGPVVQKIDAIKSDLVSLQQTQLFALTNASDQKAVQMRAVVKNATVLEFRNTDAHRIASIKPEHLKLSIPVKNGVDLQLELFRSDIFTPDFSVVTSATNGQPVPYGGGAHYWGIIKGDNASLAAISIFDDEVMGLISSPTLGNLVLGKIEQDAQQRHILYNDKDLQATDVPHCDTPEDGGGYGKDILQHRNQVQSVNCIRLYYEVNYDIYTGKGSVTAATNYVTGVFNQSAIIYSNDNIPVSLSQVYVWNTTSPYTGPSTSNFLNQFQSNVNSFNGDLGHLLGYAGGGGIAASTNGLCNSNTDYRQCYSGISSSFQNVPTYSWTVEVVTHEQGHLMGSRHTHDCAWNGNNTKIDSCGDYAGYASGTCSVGGGNQALPSNGGTIMSYCHLVGAVGINFSNGFGTQPKTAILNKYNAASCLTACTGASCNAPATMTTGNIMQTSAMFSWTAATGAVSYAIRYRMIGAANWTTGTSATTSFTASPLTPGSNYEWQVQTVCSAGSSSYTTSSNFTTLNITSCGAPSGLSATNVSGSSVNLNWNAISCDSFMVRYYATAAPNVVYYKRVTPGTATGTTLSGLTSSTNYSWLVRTYCNAGQSGSYSATATFTTTASNCGLPASLTSASVTGTSAVLSWSSVNGAASYNIRYRITGTSVWSNRTSSVNSVAVNGLSGGSVYEWQVQSVCSFGTSAFTNSSSFTTLVVCAVPTALTTSAITSTTATLNWSPVSCDSFLVRYYRTAAPNTVYFKTVTPGSATSTTITGLTSGNSYSWLIRTWCNNGQAGSYSAVAGFSTLSPSPQESEHQVTEMAGTSGGQVMIYPNPANEKVTLELTALVSGKITVRIYDLMGQMVLAEGLTLHEGMNVFGIEVSSLHEGVYYFEMEHNQNLQRTRVLISR